MSNRHLYHRLAGLLFLFIVGLLLVYAADGRPHTDIDPYLMLLAVIILLWGVRDLLHLLADMWSETE